MNRFSGFEDAALVQRIARIERAETDLLQRITARIAQVEVKGRWLRTDPQYQHLSSSLRSARQELRDTKEAHLQRRTSAARESA
jgi:Holliday junction resolvase-like predicted endonuclease